MRLAHTLTTFSSRRSSPALCSQVRGNLRRPRALAVNPVMAKSANSSPAMAPPYAITHPSVPRDLTSRLAPLLRAVTTTLTGAGGLLLASQVDFLGTTGCLSVEVLSGYITALGVMEMEHLVHSEVEQRNMECQLHVQALQTQSKMLAMEVCAVQRCVQLGATNTQAQTYAFANGLESLHSSEAGVLALELRVLHAQAHPCGLDCAWDPSLEREVQLICSDDTVKQLKKQRFELLQQLGRLEAAAAAAGAVTV